MEAHKNHLWPVFESKLTKRWFVSFVEAFCLFARVLTVAATPAHPSIGHWSVCNRFATDLHKFATNLQQICRNSRNLVRPPTNWQFPTAGWSSSPLPEHASMPAAPEPAGRVGTFGPSTPRYATEPSNTTRLLFSGQSCVDCHRDNMCYQFR